MNSIAEKKNKTIHEAQFDRRLENSKKQIEQINQGIDVKKHMGENSFTQHTGTKNIYIDEIIKYFQGKGYVAKLLQTESTVSYKLFIGW